MEEPYARLYQTWTCLPHLGVRGFPYWELHLSEADRQSITVAYVRLDVGPDGIAIADGAPTGSFSELRDNLAHFNGHSIFAKLVVWDWYGQLITDDLAEIEAHPLLQYAEIRTKYEVWKRSLS